MIKQQVVVIFHKTAQQTGEAATTTAERLINEGIEQGIEQGIKKGIRALMKLGIDSAGISAALEVSLPTVEAVIRLIRAEAK